MIAPDMPPSHVDCTYRLFRYGGRPVVSLPATPLGRRTGLRRFQPTTPRRRAFRAGVALASAMSLDRFIATEQSSPLPADMDPSVADWVASTLLRLGAASEGLVVMWPPQPDRRRVYVHASDSRGRPVAFVKIGLDERNRCLLAREVDALDHLGQPPPSTFHVPAVVATHEPARHLVVVEEPLPERAVSPTIGKAAFPSAAVAEYAGPCHESTDIRSTTWWSSYLRNLVPEMGDFDRELQRLASGGVRTVRAHGDMSPHNMAFAGRRLWLLDWEDSAPDAPVLADRVGFALATRHRRLSAAPPANWRAYLGNLPDQFGRPARVDLMLALAFRHARGFTDAAQILRNWNRSEGWGD